MPGRRRLLNPIFALLLVFLLITPGYLRRSISPAHRDEKQLALYPGRIDSLTVAYALPPAGKIEAAPALRQELNRFLRHPPPGRELPGQLFPAASLTVAGTAGRQTYRFDAAYVYGEQPARAYPLSPELAMALAAAMTRIRAQSYGELLSWTDASRLFPKGAIGTIRDLETGLSFRVQRRAGSEHADVQPLTPADTAVMHRIYGGRWDWDRRAALLEINGRRLAASMNGMPHGAGALQNNFPGHFCLHFAGSRLHVSREVDPSHQLMVQKSAGLLPTLVQQAEPPALVTMFCEGLRQEDKTTVLLTSLLSRGDGPDLVDQALSRLADIKLKYLRPAPAALPGRATFVAGLEVQPAGAGRSHFREMTIECLQPPGWQRWFVISEPVLQAI